MMEKFEIFDKYYLKKNPFPPAASSIESGGELYISEKWKSAVDNNYNDLKSGAGAKAFPIIGEYGSGKTAFLKGYLKKYFEDKNFLVFYFENPGTQFYDLANDLFRNIGRYEFSKAIWELTKNEISSGSQTTLFKDDFPDFLNKLKTKKDREIKEREIKLALQKIDFISDEEISYRLAHMVVETGVKPYFEYKDFMVGKKESIVAEKMEDTFFSAIIQLITKIYNYDGIVFLIDEFEDVAISKRLTMNKSLEYLATLRNLLNISNNCNLWIAIAMTHQAATKTKELNQPLWERFTHDETTSINLDPFTLEESKELFANWLSKGRIDSFKDDINMLYPFSDDYLDYLDNDSKLRLPRKLVKLGFFSLAYAINEQLEPPIKQDVLKIIIEKHNLIDA